MNAFAEQFELSRAGSGSNVRAMEGVRGFAVFLVFLAHYTTLSAPWISNDTLKGITAFIHAVGNTGVDLFFVLSGYLIYASLIRRRQPYAKFLARRVHRIYPAFMVVFLLYVALAILMPALSEIPSGAANAAIYLLQNFLLLPGIVSIKPMIAVAWSLSYEMFYYLVLPLLIGALGMHARSARWRSTFFAILGAAALLYFGFNSGPVRLVMFISGILLFEVMTHSNKAPPSSALTVLVLVAGLVFVAATRISAALEIAALFVAFFVLCFRCFTGVSALSRGFSFAPLRWLGNMSYSYYLLHGLTIQCVFTLLAKIMPTVQYEALFYCFMMPVVFFITLIPAAGLFLLVERPFSLATPAAPATAPERAPVVA